MKLRRREFLHLTASAGTALLAPRVARAQAYPSRPVRLVVGFTPGGVVDIIARLIGQTLSERPAKPIVIENRPGAATNLATESVVRAPPDGLDAVDGEHGGCHQRNSVRQAQFHFIRDIARWPASCAAATWRKSIPFPRQDASGFHRLMRRPTGNHQHAGSPAGGVRSHGGRVVRDDDRHQSGARALPGAAPALADLIGGQVQVMFGSLLRRSNISGAARRGLAVLLPARARMRCRSCPRSATRAGLRGEWMVRRLRPEPHACRDRRQAEPGDQRSSCRPR